MLQSNVVPNKIRNYSSDDLFEMAMVDVVWPSFIAHKTVDGEIPYNMEIKSFLCGELNLSWRLVDSIVEGLRYQEYLDPLKQLVKLIIYGTDVLSRQEFLRDDFIDKVKERVIVNNHDEKAIEIDDVANNLVSHMIMGNGNGLSNLRWLHA